MDKQTDRVFFEENIAPYYNEILAFITTITSDIVLSKDIAQDTMEAAWLYIDKMRNYNSIKAALIKIAKNKLIKHYKRNPECLPIEEYTDKAVSAKTTEDIIIQAETFEEINESLKSLGNKYSRIIVLRYYYGLTLKEIAIIYNKNYKTIQSQHTRAIKKLNESCMKKEDF